MKKIILSTIIALLVLSLASYSVLAGPLAGKKIYIDPGHGGKASGAVGPTGLKEKDVNLRVALVVRNCLVEYGGATVRMSRTTDVYHDISTWIPQDANNWGAHRFVSIHHNADPYDKSVNYTSTWSYKYTNDPTTLDLRNKINEELTKWGNRFGGPKVGHAWKDDFAVLRLTKMPAALTEGSFISNPKEEARLRDKNYTWWEGYYIYRGNARHYGVNKFPQG